MPQTASLERPREIRELEQAPLELVQGRLRRLGEGIGKVVYASEHWVVKRERSPSEIVALIGVWKLLRKIERHLPEPLGRRLVERPSAQIRFLRVLAQASMAVLPKALWFTAHIQQVWKQYYLHGARGERLAREHLAGSPLIPEEVTFPPVRVSVGGWPGSLTVSEATERVETTLHQKLTDLANAGRFDELEQWLDRFIATRRLGWGSGLFSLDAHLKNFGIVQNRIVLIDVGGLTNRWIDIERRLALEEGLAEPHVRLGLGKCLASRPDIASRFDEQWKASVNRDAIRDLWPHGGGR